MSSLFISSGGSNAGSSGVWNVSGAEYQYIYNAFTPGEDVNLDSISVSTNTYDGTQSNPGNFQVGIYGPGINASTPGSVITYLSGPTSPIAGAYNSYSPTSPLSLQAGSQYWLGFTLSSDTGGSNDQRVKIVTSDGSSSFTASGWSVGTRYMEGTAAGFPLNSTRPVTFELYGTRPSLAVCFCMGTMIRCPEGEIPIESLKIGDPVITSEGVMPVKWIGRRLMTRSSMPDDLYKESLPIVIREGSLDDGVPSRELRVSESHGISVDGRVTNAFALTNELTITKAAIDEYPHAIQYLHIEFDREVFVFANGALACSYVNSGNRRTFDNYPEFISLYGNPESTVRYRIRSQYPRNQMSLEGHKKRVRRAWETPIPK